MAVLGALSVEPMSGSAIRESIRDVLGHFWSESYGQIHPALTQLERQRFVDRRHGARAGSSLYSLTDAGRTRLRELLASPIQTSPHRNGLLLRLFFGRVLGPAACRELVLTARGEALHRQAAQMEIRRVIAAESGIDPYVGITLSFGEHANRAVLTWADETLALLAKLSAETPEP